MLRQVHNAQQEEGLESGATPQEPFPGEDRNKLYFMIAIEKGMTRAPDALPEVDTKNKGKLHHVLLPYSAVAQDHARTDARQLLTGMHSKDAPNSIE